MESPRKLNDCYFYYYSTCIKGDNCVFRHEPSALGCETMCTAWQQGKCLDKRCKLRHMELRKNRKQIPCYWENQPGGCRKKHCPFMHKNPDARTDGIAPSQPAPPVSQPVVVPSGGPGGPGAAVSESSAPLVSAVSVSAVSAVSVPQPPVPLLWPQQQRQVVVDSAILGVLPPSELLPRRMLTSHAHAHAHAHEPHAHAHAPPNPYAPLPVDPLVVNFEEESDNESALSSTPTKTVSPEEGPASKSQELLLLERIQAEAAAYYRYDALPPPDADRKMVRANLHNKYDRLSLDELAGKKQNTERRSSLDFKVLSLEEIRARKKSETIIHTTPITLNLSRKRKLSTHETITTSGNKIIKVVRSNSIVYKKLDPAPAAPSQPKADLKHTEDTISRKRTLSELSIDIYDIQDDELDDNCQEFKKIKVAEQTQKPKLIRNRSKSNKESSDTEPKSYEADSSTRTDDSDSEVQLVSIEINEKQIDVSSDIIDVDTSKFGEPIDIVDLSDEDPEESDVTVSDLSGLVKNVPDVVASCHRNAKESTDEDVICDIDAILDDDL